MKIGTQRKTGVICSRQHFQVVWAVIEAVIVFVMNMLGSCKWTAQNCLSYNTVLPSPSAVLTFDLPVPLFDTVPVTRVGLLSSAHRQPSPVILTTVAFFDLLSSFFILPSKEARTALATAKLIPDCVGDVGSREGLFAYRTNLFDNLTAHVGSVSQTPHVVKRYLSTAKPGRGVLRWADYLRLSKVQLA